MDPSNEDSAELLNTLQPCPDEQMEAYHVSTLVNRPENDTEECLRAFTEGRVI